ncbi:MAG: hypothetical protein IPK53_03955 [bacterium]|nr:hypothetical protein [bacterium]
MSNFDQWRYDSKFDDICPVIDLSHSMAHGHTIDRQVQAVRSGWLPSYPQFDRGNPRPEVAKEARSNGATDKASIVKNVVDRLKAGRSLSLQLKTRILPNVSLSFFTSGEETPLYYRPLKAMVFSEALSGNCHTNLIAKKRAKEGHVDDVVARQR